MSWDRVSPSPDRVLRPGERLDIEGYERLQRPWTLQRLAEDVWWAEVRGFQATVLVAEGGVLLIDPLAGRRAPDLVRAIEQLTDHPVLTLLYSHHHIDHIGDAALLRDAHPGLEILATPSCAAAICAHEVDVPAPTRLLEDDSGVLQWHGREIEFGPAPGHCSDNTWFLIRVRGVLHCVDLIHPGGLEFEGFGLAEDVWLYERTLERLAELDWKVMVAGHREIGWPADLELVRGYLAELRGHTRAAAAALPASQFADPAVPMHRWPVERKRAVVAAAVEAMAPRWGGWPQFPDVATSHAAAVFDDSEYFGSGSARETSASAWP